jgi:hypothetical protein
LIHGEEESEAQDLPKVSYLYLQILERPLFSFAVSQPGVDSQGKHPTGVRSIKVHRPARGAAANISLPIEMSETQLTLPVVKNMILRFYYHWSPCAFGFSTLKIVLYDQDTNYVCWPDGWLIVGRSAKAKELMRNDRLVSQGSN